MCFMCQALGHQGHKCEQLTTKAASAKQQLEKIMDTINVYLNEAAIMSKYVKRHSVKIIESADTMKMKTSLKVADIIRELRERERSH